VVLESIPSPTQGDNTPPDSDRDAPGANEDEQEFQHNDEQIVKSIQAPKRLVVHEILKWFLQMLYMRMGRGFGSAGCASKC